MRVFVLLYAEVAHTIANNHQHAEQRLRALHANVHVLSHRSRFSEHVWWSHHEKCVIIDQTVAFVGGIDLAAMRYDDSHHRLTDSARVWRGKDYHNVRVQEMASMEHWNHDGVFFFFFFVFFFFLVFVFFVFFVLFVLFVFFVFFVFFVLFVFFVFFVLSFPPLWFVRSLTSCTSQKLLCFRLLLAPPFSLV